MSKIILSLDGGGIRGAATTQFLALVEKRLQSKYQKSIRDCVDFYAGTSTGSIIALALATTTLTMEEINNLYSPDSAKLIFSENIGFFEWDGKNAPKFEAEGKTKMLIKNLKNATLGDVPDGKHVLAVTYGIEKRKPLVLKSTNPNHLSIFSSQAADASSAAPTFFPTKELDILNDEEDSYWLVDGGVIANNPTLCAVAEARKAWDVSMSDIKVLSVGTGFMSKKINGPASTKWGAMQWMLQGHIMEIVSDERIVDYQAATLLDNGNYIRVNTKLVKSTWLPDPPDDAMDDISSKNIKKLKALGTFWDQQYGAEATELLNDSYTGDSLGRTSDTTGNPK